MMKIAKMLRNRKGFTLVELMVVVVVIGILAAIAVPKFSTVTADAEKSACLANLRTLDSAAVQYYAKNKAYPATTDDGTLLKDYLQAVPTCPAKGTYSNDGNGHYACSVTAHK